MLAALAAVCVLAGALAVWLVRPNAPPAARTISIPPIPPRPPSAQIVRVPSNGLAVINLGLGDQVEQGMTFDVYDKTTGAPPPKALIEIVRIGPGFSECRIVSRTQGVAVVQGDPVRQRPAPGGRTAIAHPTNP